MCMCQWFNFKNASHPAPCPAHASNCVQVSISGLTGSSMPAYKRESNKVGKLDQVKKLEEQRIVTRRNLKLDKLEVGRSDSPFKLRWLHERPKSIAVTNQCPQHIIFKNKDTTIASILKVFDRLIPSSSSAARSDHIILLSLQHSVLSIGNSWIRVLGLENWALLICSYQPASDSNRLIASGLSLLCCVRHWHDVHQIHIFWSLLNAMSIFYKSSYLFF